MKPLFPKATAVWLFKHTALTLDQIAKFCHLHMWEVKAIADGDIATDLQERDPVVSGELTQKEIDRCTANPMSELRMTESAASLNKEAVKANKKAKYTPMSRRACKPEGVSWLLENCPEMSDGQIIKLIGTTKSTIEKVRSGTHWNMNNIKSKDPVLLGLCTQSDLNMQYAKAVEKHKSGVTSQQKDRQNDENILGGDFINNTSITADIENESHLREDFDTDKSSETSEESS